MVFTREDILKILNALLQLGRKDSEFKDANTPLNSDDEIAILQDGINKKVSINNLLSTLGLLKKDYFINVSDRYDEYYIQLSEAITIISNNKRKKGLVITFQDLQGNWKIFQFDGELNNFSNTDYWKDLFDFKYPIVDSILPDEEDLTLTLPDINNNTYIKLKDRDYDALNFSGKATKILRKNIKEINEERKNILTQSDFNKENCIYYIKYDFDLNSETIIIPNNSVLNFIGGSLYNGTLNFNGSTIKGNIQIDCDILNLGNSIVYAKGLNLENNRLKSIIESPYIKGLYLEPITYTSYDVIVIDNKSISIFGNNATIFFDNETAQKPNNGLVIQFSKNVIIRDLNIILNYSDYDIDLKETIKIDKSSYITIDSCNITCDGQKTVVWIHDNTLNLKIINSILSRELKEEDIEKEKHSGGTLWLQDYEGSLCENYEFTNNTFLSKSIDDSIALWTHNPEKGILRNVSFNNCTYYKEDISTHPNEIVIDFQNYSLISFNNCNIDIGKAKFSFVNRKFDNINYITINNCNIKGNIYKGVKIYNSTIYGNCMGSDIYVYDSTIYSSQSTSVSDNIHFHNCIFYIDTPEENEYYIGSSYSITNFTITNCKFYGADINTGIKCGIFNLYKLQASKSRIIFENNYIKSEVLANVNVLRAYSNVDVDNFIIIKNNIFDTNKKLLVLCSKNVLIKDNIYLDLVVSFGDTNFSNNRIVTNNYSKNLIFRNGENPIIINSIAEVKNPINGEIVYYFPSNDNIVYLNGWKKSDNNDMFFNKTGASTERPSNPTIGYIYKDTTLNKLIVWDGSNWLNMDGSSLS